MIVMFFVSMKGLLLNLCEHFSMFNRTDRKYNREIKFTQKNI